MAYITPATDVSEVDVLQFITASDTRLTLWMTAVTNEINALGYELGLDDDTISATLNPIVKEFAVAYYCYIVFRDNIGAVLLDDLTREKYKQKFDIYGIECNRFKKRCTKEMLYHGTDEDSITDIERAPVNMLVRG